MSSGNTIKSKTRWLTRLLGPKRDPLSSHKGYYSFDTALEFLINDCGTSRVLKNLLLDENRDFMAHFRDMAREIAINNGFLDPNDIDWWKDR